MVYVLGEIMGLDAATGAAIMEISPAAARKRLQRSRGPGREGWVDPGKLLRASSRTQVRRFPAAAADRGGFASVRVVPLHLRGEAIGALNLFHHISGPLPEPDLARGQALADVATIGILSERAIRRGEILNEQLQIALNSRIIIEQAKGVLARHLSVSVDLAFELLRRYSRTHNRRLADVARATIELTALPTHSSGNSPPASGPATGGLRHTERMSLPQPELRVLLKDGPHAGQTISVEPDDEGRPPERITVDIPGEGLQVRQQPAAGAGSEDPSDTYRQHGSNEELGLWVYRHIAD